MIEAFMHDTPEHGLLPSYFSRADWEEEPWLMTDPNWRVTLDTILDGESELVNDQWGIAPMKYLGYSDSRSSYGNMRIELLTPPGDMASVPAQSAEPEAEESGLRPDPLLQQIEEAFADFVGMQELKTSIYRQASLFKVQQLRESMGIVNPDPPSRHMVFYGAPGTGKTTVARIIAKLYNALGLLKTDNVVEAEQSMMIAEYLGQTPTKTRELIESALGGVLFIDEAYSLTNREHNDYGKEAVETLLKMMEDHLDNLVVIVAGYSGEMKQFLAANPGLLSRFSRHLTFPNYNDEELWQILQKICAQNSYVIHDEESVRLLLLECFNDAIHSQGEHFGNARYVRNLFERTIEMQALRLMMSGQRSLDDVMRLELGDFMSGITEIAKQSLE